MVLAKDAGVKPRELAELIAAELRPTCRASPSAEVAGPGFINLTLDRGVLARDALRAALAAGPDYGRGDLGRGEPVNVEYVSANPTGPMHVGHCRGAVFGDALANLLAFAGYAVTREYYINDAGAQVDVLARSAFLRYREALGENIGAIPDGLYPGDYLKPVGQALAAEHGGALQDRPEADWLPLVREHVDRHDDGDDPRRPRGAQRPPRRVLLRALAQRGQWRRRRRRPSRSCARKGLVYEGRLPPPKGQPVEDWEDREQTLFRSTAVRRRRRPAADEVGRQLHLFRLRHRLSPDEVRARLPPSDRRLGRRPRRLRQAHAGGGAGGHRRQAPISTSSSASWCSCCATASR